VTDFSDNPEKGALDSGQPDDLVIEVVDEQALRDARERNAARVRLLWNKRRFLLRATICGLIAATLIAFLIPKRYESTAELMPPDQTSGTGAAMLAALSNRVGGSLATLAESALGVKTTGDLFIGILQSDTVRDDLIKKFDLQKVYRTRYIEDTRKVLADHTGISADTKSGIITVSITDHDPQRAAAMAQEYVHELNWVVAHLSTSSAHRERVFLDQRLKQVKANLEDSEKQFSQFASQKGAIDIPAQGKALVTAAATLQGELIAAQSELEAYKQIYTDNNVRVRSMQARVNQLHSSLEKLAGKGANEKSSAQQLYPSLRELPVLGVTYADLLRRMKVEEAVFEILTQEDELAKVQEAKDTPSVTVLDPPLVPDKKSFPPRLLILVFGTTLAFVFGATWILASSAWDAVDPNDPRKAVAIEVWSDVHSSLPWNSHNGSPNSGSKNWLRSRFRRSGEDSSGE
jgi:capsule polysaccharide export protein KpsE/RkpR